MQLLQHASGCRNQQCPSANCNKMKVRERQAFILLDRSSQNLLKHGANCTTRVQGGCAICRRIWALLQIHARQCRREACVVPKCRQLKEQLRALAQQQAQMDERRRAAMNAAYRRYQMNPNHTL
jgi:E1A/CREB-binding protein